MTVNVNNEKDKKIILTGAWFTILLDVLILAGIGVIIVSMFALKKSSDQKESDLKNAVNVQPQTNVKVTTVNKINMRELITLPGIIEPFDKVVLGAEVSGRLEWLGAKEGDLVQAGQVLVRIDLRTLQANVKQAESNLKQAESALTQAEGLLDQSKSSLVLAQSTYERKKGLYEQKNISDQDFDQAKAQLDGAKAAQDQAEAGILRAKAGVLTAQSALDMAKIQLSKGEIKAPMTGIVSKINIKVDEFANVGMTIAEIVQVDPVKAVINLPEKDVAFVNSGSSMDVFIDACTERAASGDLPISAGNSPSPYPTISKDGIVRNAKVTFIAPVADQLTRTFRTELVISNAQNIIKSGMVIRATFSRRDVMNTIAVPLSSIVPKNGQYYVFVAVSKNDIELAERREVVLGVREFDPLRAFSGTDSKTMKNLATQYQQLLGNGDHLMVVGQPDPARAFIVGTRIQVIKGLHVGDRLVIEGQAQLDDGYPLKINTDDGPKSKTGQMPTTPKN